MFGRRFSGVWVGIARSICSGVIYIAYLTSFLCLGLIRKLDTHMSVGALPFISVHLYLEDDDSIIRRQSISHSTTICYTL